MSRLEKFEVAVTRRRLGDLFTTCMESGFSPWVRQADLAPEATAALAAYAAGNQKVRAESKDGSGMVWWGHPGVWEADGLIIELRYDREEDEEGSGRGVVHIRIPDLLRGLSLLCSAGRVEAGPVIDGDFDGPDADSWLRHVVFGKLVYG